MREGASANHPAKGVRRAVGETAVVEVKDRETSEVILVSLGGKCTEYQWVSESKCEYFSRAMVRWYRSDRRPFPWRESDSLYYVTVCEVLLQRTNAEKVATVTNQLFQKFPEPKDLANAEQAELARILQPLGLPHRIERVRQIALTFTLAREEGREITNDDLNGLPGVGPYSLAAVRVLVLNQHEALIDEHVLRVLRRVFTIHAPPRRHPTKALREFARRLVPPSRAKAYNLAILDLGRLVCRPKEPQCSGCPIRCVCDHAKRSQRLNNEASSDDP